MYARRNLRWSPPQSPSCLGRRTNSTRRPAEQAVSGAAYFLCLLQWCQFVFLSDLICMPLCINLCTSLLFWTLLGKATIFYCKLGDRPYLCQLIKNTQFQKRTLLYTTSSGSMISALSLMMAPVAVFVVFTRLLNNNTQLLSIVRSC